MTSYKSSAELKNMAREKLTGKYGSAILFYLSYLMITFCITFILTSFTTLITGILAMATGNADGGPIATILLNLLSLLCSVILGVFNTGNSLFFLNMACGRTYAVSNLFYGFQYLFKPSLTISAINVVISTACMIPYDIFYYLYRADGSTQNAILMIIFMLAGYAVLLPISLSLSQAYFLLLDFPQADAKEILSMSIRVMKGRKAKLFYIQLSFLPLLILGVLSCGIGNLWITPYMNMTLTYYFLDIMKPATRE